jgi:hypothetical protein
MANRPWSEWTPEQRERHRSSCRRSYLKARTDVLDAYGGKCKCCGETTPEFLGIDHIHGDGAHDRKVLGMSGVTLYRKLRREGYPTDRFQLLCHNCNQAKGYYGQCPHARAT